MPARKPPPPDQKPQFERFLETAREVGAAETDEGLERVVRAMVKPKGDKEITPSVSPKASQKSPKCD
jgi:hypothetical protein